MGGIRLFLSNLYTVRTPNDIRKLMLCLQHIYTYSSKHVHELIQNLAHSLSLALSVCVDVCVQICECVCSVNS